MNRRLLHLAAPRWQSILLHLAAGAALFGLTGCIAACVGQLP